GWCKLVPSVDEANGFLEFAITVAMLLGINVFVLASDSKNGNENVNMWRNQGTKIAEIECQVKDKYEKEHEYVCVCVAMGNGYDPRYKVGKVIKTRRFATHNWKKIMSAINFLRINLLLSVSMLGFALFDKLSQLVIVVFLQESAEAMFCKSFHALFAQQDNHVDVQLTFDFIDVKRRYPKHYQYLQEHVNILRDQ
ncbi:hypothetical protein RFI_30952, partial [Reticulomyxa filosa]